MQAEVCGVDCSENEKKGGTSHDGDAGEVEEVRHQQGEAGGEKETFDGSVPDLCLKMLWQLPIFCDRVADPRGTIEGGIDRGAGGEEGCDGD